MPVPDSAGLVGEDELVESLLEPQKPRLPLVFLRVAGPVLDGLHVGPEVCVDGLQALLCALGLRHEAVVDLPLKVEGGLHLLLDVGVPDEPVLVNEVLTHEVQPLVVEVLGHLAPVAERGHLRAVVPVFIDQSHSSSLRRPVRFSFSFSVSTSSWRNSGEGILCRRISPVPRYPPFPGR